MNSVLPTTTQKKTVLSPDDLHLLLAIEKRPVPWRGLDDVAIGEQDEQARQLASLAGRGLVEMRRPATGKSESCYHLNADGSEWLERFGVTVDWRPHGMVRKLMLIEGVDAACCQQYVEMREQDGPASRLLVSLMHMMSSATFPVPETNVVEVETIHEARRAVGVCIAGKLQYGVCVAQRHRVNKSLRRILRQAAKAAYDIALR